MSQVLSFVEELVIEDDPEYKWIDKIRTTRASNEARQLLFLRLAASLQRKVCEKSVDKINCRYSYGHRYHTFAQKATL